MNQLPQTIYASIAGPVDQPMVQRVFQSIAVAVNGRVRAIHSILQTNGGAVGEGIALYNYCRAMPIDLHLYNVGTIASIGVIAFLGARHRYASAHATFMIHKSHFVSPTPTDAERSSRAADALKIEDARTLAILCDNLTVSVEEIERHRASELLLDAKTALAWGLIKEIREFTVPPGNVINNI